MISVMHTDALILYPFLLIYQGSSSGLHLMFQEHILHPTSIFLSVLFPLPEMLFLLGGMSCHSGSLVGLHVLLYLSIFHLLQCNIIFQYGFSLSSKE